MQFGGDFESGVGAAEPVGEVGEEVAVAVGGAGVGGVGAVGGAEGVGVGLVGGEVVEAGGGLVFDEDGGGAAAGGGAPGDIVVATGDVGVAVGVGLVHLVLTGGVIDLVEEAVEDGIAEGGVGAAVAHGGTVLKVEVAVCAGEPAVAGPGVGDEALFFLEDDDEGLGVDAAALGDAVDDFGGGLVEGAVAFAVGVGTFGVGGFAVIFEARGGLLGTGAVGVGIADGDFAV